MEVPLAHHHLAKRLDLVTGYCNGVAGSGRCGQGPQAVYQILAGCGRLAGCGEVGR